MLCRNNEALLVNGRRSLGFLHRACRRRRARRPRGLNLRPLRRALSRRSGAPRPASAERRPDGESARRNRLRHRLWSVDRQKNERQAVAPGSRRVVARATLCSPLRRISLSCSSSRRSRWRSAGPPFPSRLRSSNGISTTRTFTPPIAPSASFAPAGRSLGPSDPRSGRRSSGRSDFAARFSQAPLPAWSR